MKLIEKKTILTRPATFAPDGFTYVVTWVDVEDGDGEDKEQGSLPVLLMRERDGAVQLIAAGAAEAFGIVPRDLPEGVGTNLSHTPPPTSQDGAVMTPDTVRSLCGGERPDLAQLYADLHATFMRFVAFPSTGDASPDDYAALCAAYTISTYLIGAFDAVGYLWLTGLRGSGKTTVAQIIARTACLPLMAGSSSTIASLRGHADAGGAAILDNWETLHGKDDHSRAMRDFVEAGYQRGGVVTLQVPSAGGRGWETQRCHVFANRVFTAVAEPGNLESRCITVTMMRTADTAKADLSPWDDDNWTTKPAQLVQTGWMVAAHHLADAARTVKTIKSTDAALTNRDLQIWRPVLTVARLVDKENGNTAAWDTLLRLAHALLHQRADDDGSREAIITRVLATLHERGEHNVTASRVMGDAAALADVEEREVWGIESAKQIGRVLTRMGVAKAPRTGSRRSYLLDTATITRLRITFLPPVSPNVINVTNVTNVMPAYHSGDMCDVCDERDVSCGGVGDDTANVTRPLALDAADLAMIDEELAAMVTGDNND